MHADFHGSFFTRISGWITTVYLYGYKYNETVRICPEKKRVSAEESPQPPLVRGEKRPPASLKSGEESS
jgi:DNA-binding winged helix-turn-helix (wHTH) protein